MLPMYNENYLLGDLMDLGTNTSDRVKVHPSLGGDLSSYLGFYNGRRTRN